MNAPAGAKTVRVVRVFVSSPGDVVAESWQENEGRKMEFARRVFLNHLPAPIFLPASLNPLW
jgi:hypothetical protein